MALVSLVQYEVREAIEEAFDAICKSDYIAFILFIGRAEIQRGLKVHTGTDCVMEYKLDIYHDETRTDYYLDYMRRNYSREGYNYEGPGCVNDMTTELTIYSHLWESSYFMKSLFRIAAIIQGKGYLWENVLPMRDVHKHFFDNVIVPLKESGLKLGTIIEKGYKPSIRNAFAHSLYTVDATSRTLYIRPKSGCERFTFEAFQEKFLYSVILMNKMENYQERNHNLAAEKDTALTIPFLTPDGVRVQVLGKVVKRGDELSPEFRLVKVIDK